MKNLIPILFILFGFIAEAQSLQINNTHSNILYRNVEQPIEITTDLGDEIGPVSAVFSMPGIKGSDGNFTITPGGQDKTARLTVSARKKDGKTVSHFADFRIKNIPPITAVIDHKTFIELDWDELTPLQIEAYIYDFLFPLEFEIVDFEIKIPNSNPVKISGNRLTPEVLQKIKKVKKGEHLTIQNINIQAVEGYHGEDNMFQSLNPIVIKIK